MEIIKINASNILLNENRDISLCLGFFDGVHLGHISLFDARNKNNKFAVMTFDESPSVIFKNLKQSYITPLRDKINLFEHIGVEVLYVLHADSEMISLSKSDFIEKILKSINPNEIIVGADYTFGYKGEGNAEFIAKHFKTKIVPLLVLDNQKVASREIKELISNGNIKKANNLLDRYYFIKGIVVEGKKNGRLIGFPTANISLCENYLLPGTGVYIGYTIVDGKKYKSIIDVSTHPTIDELKENLIESNILNFDEDIYGKEIELQFVEYIRDVSKFNSLDDLAKQLEKDTNYAKNTLK